MTRHVVALLGASLVPGCGGSSPVGSLPVVTPTPVVAEVVVTVTRANNAVLFRPDPVTLRLGQAISWANEDSVVHHLVGDRAEFDSTGIAAGRSSPAVRPAGTGSIPYHCVPHPTERGSVTVSN